MAKHLKQAHRVEAPSGSEQSFHSSLELEKNLGPAPFNSGSPGSVRGMSPDKKMGPSVPGEMRMDLEERGLGSQQDEPVPKFSPSVIIPAPRSQLLKKSDTSQVGDCSPMSSTNAPAERDVSDKTPNGGKLFAGPSLRRDLSSAASHVSSSGEMRGGSKKSIKLFGVELIPSAGQREETSMSERPYQRDGAFVDQSDGYPTEVNEHGLLLESDLAPLLPSQSSQPSAKASLAKVEMGSGYECQYCSKKFSSKRGLGIHQGKLHRKEQPVRGMQRPLSGALKLLPSPRRGFVEVMAGRSGHDPQRRIEMSHPDAYSPNRMSYPSSTAIPSQSSQPSFEPWVSGVEMRSDYVHSSQQQGHQQQSQGRPHAIDDTSLDLELPLGPPGSVPPLRSKSSQPSGKSRVPPVETRSRSEKCIKLFGVEIFPSVDQSDGYTIDVKNGSQVRDDEMVADVKSDPRGMAGGDNVRSDLKEEQGKGGSVSSDSNRSYDCQYCSKKFPKTRNLLALFQAQEHQEQSQGPAHAGDDTSLDLELRLGPPGSVPPLRSKCSQPSGNALVPPVETRSDNFSSHEQREQQQSQGPFAADDSSLDLELRLGPPGSVPPLRSKSSQPSGKSRVPPVETRSRSKKCIKLFGVEIFPSAGQREETSMSKRPHQRHGAFVDQSDGYTIDVKNGSQLKDDEMVADIKSDPRGMAGGDNVRSDLKEEQGKGGSVSSDSKRSYDCQYCSRKFPKTRNLLALFQAQEQQQQSQGQPHAVDYTSLDLELRLGPPGSVPPLRSKSSQPSGKPRVPPVETRGDNFSSHQQGEQQQSQGPFAADDSSLDLELRLGPPRSVPPNLHSQRSGKPSGEARVSGVETPSDCFSSSHEQGKQQAQSQRP